MQWFEANSRHILPKLYRNFVSFRFHFIQIPSYPMEPSPLTSQYWITQTTQKYLNFDMTTLHKNSFGRWNFHIANKYFKMYQLDSFGNDKAVEILVLNILQYFCDINWKHIFQWFYLFKHDAILFGPIFGFHSWYTSG